MYKVLVYVLKKRGLFSSGHLCVLEDVGGIHLSVWCCWCSYSDSMVSHSILKPGELWALSEALQGHTLQV